MSKRMKVLFAGLGSIGQRHVRNLRELLGEDVEILAYRQRRSTPTLNPDMTVRTDATLEETYGIKSFNSLDDALGERPQVAFITNPNIFHMPVALAAAEAGCHLFIEKPVSHSLEKTDDLLKVVRRNRLVAFVAYQFRFHPGLLAIKALIDEGRIGRLAAAHIVNGEYLPDWHPYEDYRDTHPARREMGGGCLNIQNHELDYALWLFGMPNQLHAVGGHLSSLQVDVEDSVSVLLSCGREGNSFPVHIHLDYLQRPPQRTCEIIGDAGKLRFDYYSNRLEHYDTASRAYQVTDFSGFERNQMFIDELKHFLACVEGKAEPLVSLKEGIQSLKVILAAHSSLKSGQAVKIEND
jgi:predicted dehydrogenase